jgi:hypothetical protein
VVVDIVLLDVRYMLQPCCLEELNIGAEHRRIGLQVTVMVGGSSCLRSVTLAAVEGDMTLLE